MAYCSSFSDSARIAVSSHQHTLGEKNWQIYKYLLRDSDLTSYLNEVDPYV